MNALEIAETFAVLTLSETGEILAARDACMTVFGREVGALIGVNIRILLKGGLDNEVGRLLHGHRTGKNPSEAAPLQVVGLKKDGAEFMASAATVKWNSDTAVTKKADVARLTWTLAFRDLSACDENATRVSPNESVNTEPQSVDKADDSKVNVPQASPTRRESESAPQNKDGLNSKTPLISEKSAAETHRNAESWEEQLREMSEKLEATKAEANLRAEEQRKVEFDLRAQLEAARETVGRAEAALKDESERKERLEERLQTLSSSLRLEQAERSKRFEQELISLRQERDELDRKLAAEQGTATESTEKAEELEKQLGKNAADFERAKAELEQQDAERERVESAWREQLDTAFIAKKQIEGAWAGEVERSKRFEEELSKLRQQHDELIAKLATEQKVALESRQRAKDVEGRLGRNAAESERARAELEKETAERERVESVWRGQLDEAKARKEKAELALAEANKTNKRLEQEFAKLNQVHDELNRRLVAEQKAAAESATRAEALQRAVNKGAIELERVQGAKAKLEQANSDAAERGLQLESALAVLQQKHDGLAAKLAVQQTAAEKSKARVQELEDELEQTSTRLESLRAELESHSGSRNRFESDWKKQLDEAKAQKRELEAAWTGAVDRNMHFEELLSALRKERDELARKLKAEKQAVVQARQQFEDLQCRLDQSAGEAARIRSESEKSGIAQAHAETEWNKRLETATSLTKKLEGAWAEAVARNQRLESELENLRRERDEANAKSATARKLGVETGKQTAVAPSRPVRSMAERESGDLIRERPVAEHNGASNGKTHRSPANAAVEKANGHPAPERAKPANGDLSQPPKPGVGLYNLKP